MKGQIYIDYMGGALLFFLSIVFIVTSALNTIPQFSQGIGQNRLEITAWSISTQLVEDTGFWKNKSKRSTEWHKHISDPDALKEIKTIGLESEKDGLSREKIKTLLNSHYSDIKRLLKTDKEFNLQVTEFAFVDTYKSFRKPNSPPETSAFQAPDNDSYDSADAEIHYGSKSIKGNSKRFLVTSHNGSYDEVYISDDWDFSEAADIGPLGITDTQIVKFGDRNYRFEGRSSGIVASEGKVVGLVRVMGRLGRRSPEDADRVTEVNRFSNIRENPIKIEMRFWG